MRRRPYLLAALLCGPAALPRQARGDEIDELTKRVVQVEARVREIDTGIKPVPDNLVGDVAERRLIDAQVLYELKNYEASATLLLDVVQKYPSSQAYPEALYFLADSLYLKRDFLSSRKYFEEIVKVGPSHKRYQETLQRLIELSLYTGDYSPVDGYIAKLGELPASRQIPSVPYVKGKYYYFRQRYEDALAAFGQIDKAHKYWFHAQYFLGAIKVAQGKPAEAINVFADLLQVEPKSDAQKRIAELTHLALGRIYYDRAQFTNANTEYSKIAPKSELFSDALYETAWVAIKAKEFRKAFHALDLLLLARPDDPQVPEVKLLIGQLHIRSEEWDDATASFNQTREEFDPIHRQIDEIMAKQSDPQRYFQELIGKNLGKFDVASYLPPLALKWVRASPEVEHLISVTSDVNDLKKALDESDEIVARLEKTIGGPQRVNVFPELAKAREKASAATKELSEVEGKLLEREREILDPAAGAEKAQLDELSGQRRALEEQLKNAPTTADSYEERLKKARSGFDALDKQASEINVLLSNYTAQRVAIEKYYHDTAKEQKVNPEQFQSDLAQVRLIEDELRKTYEALRKEIDDATQSVGVDDAQMQQEEVVKKQLADVMTREHDLTSAIRGRLGGSERTRVDQIESVLTRAKNAQLTLASFNARIETQVDERLRDIKVAVAEEKAHVAEYRIALGGHQVEASEVGGGITAASFRAIADRFYQIVVRADVGVIDVAWALKQNKSDEDQRLVREEKRELKLLDDEFKQVLKE